MLAPPCPPPPPPSVGSEPRAASAAPRRARLSRRGRHGGARRDGRRGVPRRGRRDDRQVRAAERAERHELRAGEAQRVVERRDRQLPQGPRRPRQALQVRVQRHPHAEDGCAAAHGRRRLLGQEEGRHRECYGGGDDAAWRRGTREYELAAAMRAHEASGARLSPPPPRLTDACLGTAPACACARPARPLFRSARCRGRTRRCTQSSLSSDSQQRRASRRHSNSRARFIAARTFVRASAPQGICGAAAAEARLPPRLARAHYGSH